MGAMGPPWVPWVPKIFFLHKKKIFFLHKKRMGPMGHRIDL